MSKLTISTTQLQVLVNKANQAVSNNKFIEITEKIGIKYTSDGLMLIATDGTNTLYVTGSELEETSDINVAVNAETFVKLVSKLTSDMTTLETTDNALIVRANGAYKIPLSLDDNGEVLSFPDLTLDNLESVGTISTANIQTIISSLKSSLSDNAGSVYANYYVGDCVCSSDTKMMSIYDCDLVSGKQYMFDRAFVDLLAIAGSDISLSYSQDKNMLVAQADNFTLTSKAITDTSNFNVDAVKKFSAIEQECYCKIRKKELLDLLDRLSLFVGKYDDGAITLEFGQAEMCVSSLSSTGIEHIAYTECKNTKDMTVKININRLMTMLKSYTSDLVDLYYGHDICIKLVDGTVTQVVALMR